MSKLLLNTTVMQEEFFADTALIGIVSALPGYRFCWLLNRELGIDFSRDPDSDLLMQFSQGRQLHFPIYQFSLPLSGHKHLIYKLKSEKETLLPEANQLDYMWMIQSNTPEADAQYISQSLRNIPDIQLAQILDPGKLKSLEHLLL